MLVYVSLRSLDDNLHPLYRARFLTGRSLLTKDENITSIKRPMRIQQYCIWLHMGSNNLCYVTCHFLFFPYVPMSIFIRP